MENIVLRNAHLTVHISPLGAQVVSVRDAEGRERMWRGDADVWGYHAPVLFPVAGGFTDDYYLYNGRRYDMKRHGFARTSLFRVAESKMDRAEFVLDEAKENYPFDYLFSVAYTLEENQLQVTYTAHNRGENPMYFSVGSHEAYACEGGIERYALVFDEEERLEAHELNARGQVGDRTRLFSEHARILPLEESYFDCDTLVFMSLWSRGVRLVSGENEPSVHISFSGMDYLLVWKKKDAPFLCIEPWCNPPDPETTDHRIDHKPGMICLGKGEETSRTHVIRFD